MTESKRGGRRNGAGRPELPEGEATIVATVRLTPARKAKLQRLGAQWLARAIDKAKEP